MNTLLPGQGDQPSKRDRRVRVTLMWLVSGALIVGAWTGLHLLGDAGGFFAILLAAPLAFFGLVSLPVFFFSCYYMLNEWFGEGCAQWALAIIVVLAVLGLAGEMVGSCFDSSNDYDCVETWYNQCL